MQGADIQDPLLSPIFAEPGAFPGHCVSIIADIDPHAEDNLALSKKLEVMSFTGQLSAPHSDSHLLRTFVHCEDLTDLYS